MSCAEGIVNAVVCFISVILPGIKKKHILYRVGDEQIDYRGLCSSCVQYVGMKQIYRNLPVHVIYMQACKGRRECLSYKKT